MQAKSRTNSLQLFNSFFMPGYPRQHLKYRLLSVAGDDDPLSAYRYYRCITLKPMKIKNYVLKSSE